MPPLDENWNVDDWSVEQKLALIEKLWASIPPTTPPIPEWHLELIDRRLAAREADPNATVPFEEVIAELRSPQ